MTDDIIEHDDIINDDDTWAGITADHFRFLALRCKAPVPYALKNPYFMMSNPTADEERQYYRDLNRWGLINHLTLTEQAQNFFTTLTNADRILTAQIRVHNVKPEHDIALEGGFPSLWEGTELPLMISPGPIINASYHINRVETSNDIVEHDIVCFYANAGNVSVFTIAAEANPYRCIAQAFTDLIDPNGEFGPTTVFTKPIKANKSKVVEKALQVNEIYREKLLYAEEHGEEYKGNAFDIMKTLPDNGAMNPMDEKILHKLHDTKNPMIMSASFIVQPDFSHLPKDWRILKNMKFPQPPAVDVCAYLNNGMTITIPSETQPEYCYYHPFSVNILAKGLQILAETPPAPIEYQG